MPVGEEELSEAIAGDGAELCAQAGPSKAPSKALGNLPKKAGSEKEFMSQRRTQ